MLDTNTLFKLDTAIRNEINDNLTQILIRLDRMEQLDQFLTLLDLSNLIDKPNTNILNKSGKILVCGMFNAEEKNLYGIAKKLKIKKDRFEFCLDYDMATNYNYDKTQYNPKYSLIIVGQMAHSGHSKKEFSSVIARIENEDGFPPVIRAGSNGLKLTQSSFEEALIQALNRNIVIPDLA